MLDVLTVIVTDVVKVIAQSHKTKTSVQLTHLKIALFTITQQRVIAIKSYEKQREPFNAFMKL